LDHSKTLHIKIMNTLLKFTPAETLILLHGKKAQLKDLLKVTFMDLMMKQVLQSTGGDNLAEDQKITHSHIIAGPEIGRYPSLPHENVFLFPFDRNKSASILFTKLVKIGYDHAEGPRKYIKDIFYSPAIQSCFAGGLMRLLKGRFSLTSYGKQVVEDIKRELNELELALPELMKSNPEKAKSILKEINGNFLLLKGVDFKMMHEIDRLVTAETSSAYSSSNSGFADPITWVALDTNVRHFDSGCSTMGSESWETDSNDSTDGGDSGGGGDSGCSGCGGGD
jgi:hypothetical protein